MNNQSKISQEPISFRQVINVAGKVDESGKLPTEIQGGTVQRDFSMMRFFDDVVFR